MFGREKKDGKNAETPASPAPEGAPEGPETAPAEGEPSIEDPIAELQSKVDELNSRYLRTVADYQNAARRAARDQDEARHQGVKSVVLNVLTVLDHFDLALGQDASKVTAEQMVNGVKVIRDELMKVLQNHGVALVTPEPNEEFDPNRHQAVVQQAAEGIEPGRIVATLQAGYCLGDRIIRPAMVSVAPEAS